MTRSGTEGPRESWSLRGSNFNEDPVTMTICIRHFPTSHLPHHTTPHYTSPHHTTPHHTTPHHTTPHHTTPHHTTPHHTTPHFTTPHPPSPYDREHACSCSQSKAASKFLRTSSLYNCMPVRCSSVLAFHASSPYFMYLRSDHSVLEPFLFRYFYFSISMVDISTSILDVPISIIDRQP